MTDREGSFTQLYLQALSLKLYRNVAVSDEMKPFVEEAWNRLPVPLGIPDQGLPDPNELNYFEETPAFINRRLKRIQLVANSLSAVASGGEIPGEKIVTSRYTEGLSGIDREVAESLSKKLRSYAEAISKSQ